MKKQLLFKIGILGLLLGFLSNSTAQGLSLIHYWHFNTLSGTVTEVGSDFSAVGAGVITYPGTGSGSMDERTHRAEDPVSNFNLRMGQEPDQGAVLRVRNPSDTRELIIVAPSTGFENIVVTFATTRTSNGAQQQEFYYSPDGGNTWIKVGDTYDVPELAPTETNFGYLHKVINLNNVAAANNNPDLKFKIKAVGEGASGTAGNQRFDNLTIDGKLLVNSATINPTEVTIDYDDELWVISTVITWNDASEVLNVIGTIPDLPDFPPYEFDESEYEIIDNGDGTATINFLFDKSSKTLKSELRNNELVLHITLVFDVGNDALLIVIITNWKWWVWIDVEDKVTGNPIADAAIYIQELSQTLYTGQWGWAGIDLAVGIYTLNISAAGYITLQNQTIVVEASFDNEFIFELEPEDTGVINPNFEGIAIFPNPATTEINIRSESPIIELNLTNMLGQVVYTTNQLGNSHSVNVSSFNNGIYFVKVTTESGVLVRKVLIR